MICVLLIFEYVNSEVGINIGFVTEIVDEFGVKYNGAKLVNGRING